MGKTISATILRQNLAQLLDELEAGQSHFVVERNNAPAAVLMSVEKFAEIRRMLEMIAVQEYIRLEPVSRPRHLPADVELPPPAAALVEHARALYAAQEEAQPELKTMTARLRIVR